ncbi:MAG: hypothetical protein ACR2GO_04685 [Candidatus Limnocylindria bacterium]
MTDGTSDDELVPISVRLGQVVPPEDPEDWTRPLTWVAALGMLAGPIIELAWFIVAPPTDASRAVPATYLVTGALVGGAAATGATQIGSARAGTATLGAGLFGALVTIVLGVATAGERQIEAASPTLAHAFVAALAGLMGAGITAIVAAMVARWSSRIGRFLPAAVVGAAAGLAVVGLLLPP